MKSRLSIDLIAELNEKFKKKEWDKIYHYKNFFDRYCSFLENLEQDERKLILELTNDYEWITDSQYSGILIKTLGKLANFEYLNLEHIYIIPLLSKMDRKKNKDKSSKHVAYLCKSVQIGYNPLFSNTKFQSIDSLEGLPKETKVNSKNTPIILVDDYIGTGETAIDAVEELLEKKKYNKNLVFVLSLVTQEAGLKAVISTGVNVLYGILKQKGISDKFSQTEARERLKLMELIEDKLKVEDYNKFGYKGSEALITMIRTPNNTFPIYWLESKTDKKWKAPFPRS
jgi:uracil phosphoribosyltransferase